MRKRELYIIFALSVLICCGYAQQTDRRHRQNTSKDSILLYAKQLPVVITPAMHPLLETAGISQKDNARLTLANYTTLAEQLIHYYENHGYPFVSVSLKTVYPDSALPEIQLVLDTNRYITFDSIVLKGDVKLSKNFLYPYLGLKCGMAYQEAVFQAVAGKLEELAFAIKIRDAGVAFVNNKAYLYLYLDPNPTNQFDGYIGIVPEDKKTGKVSVNGSLDLDLQNLFKMGEQIRLSWLSSERYSQYLNVSFSMPYLLRTRFGITGSFRLDKQDTSYLTLNYHIGIPYSFASNSYLQPYFDYTGSTVLDASLLNFESDTGYIDYHKTLYGILLRYCHVDYLFNPREGLDVYANLSVGRRTILQNSQADESFYRDLDLQKVNYRLFGGVTVYIPLGKHFVMVPKVQAGTLLSGPHYYNELFKIGGEEYLRGFNINDICASTYLLGKAEVRFIFGKKSYIHLFFDGGVYEQQLTSNYQRDFPFGFGTGITFATKAGMFYLDYALSRQQNNPISFKTGKIHFGIRTQF